MACIDAMHASVPVVAFDTHGLRELVTPGTGLLADTADPATYARALDALADAPALRRTLGQGARATFGLDRAVSGTLAAYTEAIALHGRGSAHPSPAGRVS
ncbi:glycosyltransferase involved in cell wall biosynthesis [Nocardia sp. GAS34]|uniref:glycosyltransferase n=1 Tax=unclassified Nocardia TaxID=2637762 RepID=UPI003D1CE0DF